jgi:hypothetical protein
MLAPLAANPLNKLNRVARAITNTRESRFLFRRLTGTFVGGSHGRALTRY